MSSEILAVLEYMERKGISREDMIATIEGAAKLPQKGCQQTGEIRVEINPKLVRCKLDRLEVVESV